MMNASVNKNNTTLHFLSSIHASPKNAPTNIPTRWTGYAILDGLNIFRACVKKYKAPTTINGRGNNGGNITNLPGEKNVPKPIIAEIAPDAPTPTEFGDANIGNNIIKLPIIPPVR